MKTICEENLDDDLWREIRVAREEFCSESSENWRLSIVTGNSLELTEEQSQAR